MTDADRAASAAQKIAELRQRILSSAPSTVDAFLALGASLSRSPTAPEVLETLRRELHRLRGTAGSFGFDEVSHLSGALEDRVGRWTSDASIETDARATVVARFAAALRGAFGLTDNATPGPATTPAPLRVVTLDLPSAVVESLTKEAGLRGFAVVSRREGDWSPGFLKALAPNVVVTVAPSAGAVHRALHSASLPLVVLDDGTDPALSRRVARLGGARVMHMYDDPSGVFEMAGHASGRTSWSGATLLVCDDDPDVLALVEIIGQQAGVRVVTVADPNRLIEELDRVRPSLLLLDISLGDTDGLRLAAAIRQLDAYAELPLIMFSGRTDAPTREAALAAGADDFLAKPIVATELRARIGLRLEAERTRLLDRGQHPGTGVLLADRLAAALSGELRREADSALAVAVVRPVGGNPVGAARDAWHAECRRTVAQIAGSIEGWLFAGFADEYALGVVARCSVDALRQAVERVAAAAPAGQPMWFAGVAPRDSAPADAAALLAAASDAATAAEQGDTRVRAWSRHDALLAPDVVVVEDDPALAEMLRFALASYGYSMRIYRTGPEALEALRAMRPRRGRRPLVLLDIDLPGLDGHSLHERLRVERPGVFGVIFASVHSSEGDQLRALKSGAIDYLVKPISLRVVMAKLPRWLSLASAESP